MLLIQLLFFLQEMNFHPEGHILHYGQQVQNSTLNLVWDELKATCDFPKFREEVNQFNLHNRWRKRGIAMIPTKFGISFTTKFMNQVCTEHVLDNSWLNSGTLFSVTQMTIFQFCIDLYLCERCTK